MKKYLILMAAGSGTRMNENTPKQFIEIAGVPIIVHTYKQFKNITNLKTTIVLPENKFEYWKNYISNILKEENVKYVRGGKKRFISVKNGLKTIFNKKGIVAIHDGVRPLVSKRLINTLYESANKLGNAIPYTPVINTLRKYKKKSNHLVDRNNYINIQTPQVFKIKNILNSFELIKDPDYTDESSVIEKSGEKINLILGEEKNIKLTNEFDLEYFRKIII